MGRLKILPKRAISLGLMLFAMLLVSCGSLDKPKTFSNIETLSRYGDRIEVDYETQIRDAVNKAINDRMEGCPEAWSKGKCKAMSRLYVEASVWADVLDSEWKLMDACLEDGFVYVTVRRGGKIPLIGTINVGEFKHINRVWVDNKGKLVVEYVAIDEMNARDKLKMFLAGSGIGAGIMGLIWLLVIIL